MRFATQKRILRLNSPFSTLNSLPPMQNQNAWRVGALFGIPLFLDPSWFLIVAWITFTDGIQWQSAWGIPIAYSAGLAMALLLFTSVLLHELGHSLVAKKQGITVNSITLFLFGGVAAIDEEPKTPGQMFQVAIAGPLVSLSLCLIFGALLLFLPIPPAVGVIPNQVINVILLRIASLNFTLTLFNLIPGLPLDGGQMLKALVWKRSGSYLQGSQTAAKSGKWLGWAIVALGAADILGVTRALNLPYIGGLWAVLIGSFMLRNAERYSQLTDLQAVLVSLKAADSMTRDFRVLDANQTLRHFADDYVLAVQRPSVYFAASDGRYRGLVEMEALQTIERSQWETQTLQTIAKPLSEIPSVLETTPMVELIHKLEAETLSKITVLSPAGAVAGVIDRGDIVRVVADKMGFSLSDEAIRQVKEAGVFPVGLQLGAIAQSIQGLK
jgi:Zn-dependent protease/CBS domain-containing protein